MADASLTRWMDESRKHQWDKNKIAKKSVEIAGNILNEIRRLARGNDKSIQQTLNALAKDTNTYNFVQDFLKDLLHSPHNEALEAQFEKRLSQYNGIPSVFGRMASLKMSFSSLSSKGKASSLKNTLHDRFGNYYIPHQDAALTQLGKEDKRDNNISCLRPLQERILGKASAQAYQAKLLQLLQHPQTFAVEVDLSALCAKASLYHFEHSLQEISQLVRPLLEQSVKSQGRHPLILSQGNNHSLPFAVALIPQLLEDKQFDQIDICLELPAYLPISADIIQELAPWAEMRCRSDKQSTVFRSALKIRLIKGGQLEEELHAALHNRREDSVSASKQESDARYKSLVTQILQHPHLDPIFGTHDHFDIAYALLCWSKARRTGRPQFALLRGINSPLQRYLQNQGFSIQNQACLYQAEQEEQLHQELRRWIFDFTRSNSLFTQNIDLKTDSPEWLELEQKFAMSITKMETLSASSPGISPAWLSPITFAGQRKKFADALKDQLATKAISKIPALSQGKAIKSHLQGSTRSPYTQKINYHFDSLDFEHLDIILKTAKDALPKIEKSLHKRCKLIWTLGEKLQEQRAKLCALLVTDAAYSLEDADYELGQAITLCRHYSDHIEDAGLNDGCELATGRIVTIIPSPQSPLIEAIEGIAAAWITGNCILYKTNNQSLLLSQALQGVLEEAGLKAPFLQLAQCLDNQLAAALKNDSQVSLSYQLSPSFILDPKEQSPLQQKEIKPIESICSTLIMADADWKRALEENIKSFKQRTGQLNSSPHILFVEEELYKRGDFQAQLQDKFNSLEQGDGRQLQGDIGPQAQALCTEELQQLCTLHQGESWLCPEPDANPNNRALIQPLLRLGVTLASPLLQIKHIGRLPHMSIISVKDLQDGIAQQSQISQGYKAGICSNNEETLKQWRRHMPVAHAYVNTAPQAYLPGLQAEGELQQNWAQRGGANYIASLGHWVEKKRPQQRSEKCQIPFTPWELITPRPKGDDLMRLRAAADSISLWWDKEYGIRHKLADNEREWTELRYQALPLCIRAEENMTDVDLAILLMNGLKTGTRVELSMKKQRLWAEGRLESLGVRVILEDREEFERRMMGLSDMIVRDPGAGDKTREIARTYGIRLSDERVLANGRIEMMRICREKYTSVRNSAIL